MMSSNYNGAYLCIIPQVMSAVHGVYQALLSLKNIPTLEAAYKMVLGEMACALCSLTATLEPASRATVPDDFYATIHHPAFASITLQLEKAQFTLIFNLSTLTTIGNTKNSLIGVRFPWFSLLLHSILNCPQWRHLYLGEFQH